MIDQQRTRGSTSSPPDERRAEGGASVPGGSQPGSQGGGAGWPRRLIIELPLPGQRRDGVSARCWKGWPWLGRPHVPHDVARSPFTARAIMLLESAPAILVYALSCSQPCSRLIQHHFDPYCSGKGPMPNPSNAPFTCRIAPATACRPVSRYHRNGADSPLPVSNNAAPAACHLLSGIVQVSRVANAAMSGRAIKPRRETTDPATRRSTSPSHIVSHPTPFPRSTPPPTCPQPHRDATAAAWCPPPCGAASFDRQLPAGRPTQPEEAEAEAV